jgi:hypothetical protein
MASRTADLVLLSEYRRQAVDNTAAADLTSTDKQRLRELLAEASEIWSFDETLCRGRRFDRRVETRYYTPRSLTHLLGGDLLDSYTLQLDDDLQAITTLTNGDDTTIESTSYTLLPQQRGAYITAYDTIALQRYAAAQVYWKTPTAPNTDPLHSISIVGTWGFGGVWKLISGSTVRDDPLAADTTTVEVTAATFSNYEQEQVLKLNSEYVRVTADPTDVNVAIERGYNGSTAAAHDQGTAIYRFIADDRVRRNVIRLTAWMVEQQKSPMFGQVVVADVALPTVVEAYPKDVVKAAQGLRRAVGVIL